jgi:hypothetical protein
MPVIFTGCIFHLDFVLDQDNAFRVWFSYTTFIVWFNYTIVWQAKIHDKELELEAKFDARVQQLQSTQQTLLEKLSALEQRTVAMQLSKRIHYSCAIAALTDAAVELM